MGKNDVTYGEKNLINKEDLAPEKATIAISLRVPGDILMAYKELAEQFGEGYQTLMIEKLRSGLESDADSSILQMFHQMKAGLTQLEKDMIRAGVINRGRPAKRKNSASVRLKTIGGTAASVRASKRRIG